MANLRDSLTRDDLLNYEADEKRSFSDYTDKNEEDYESSCTNQILLDPEKQKIAKSSSFRWISMGVLSVLAALFGAGIGYSFKQGCTEKQCIRMTSSYCELREIWVAEPG